MENHLLMKVCIVYLEKIGVAIIRINCSTDMLIQVMSMVKKWIINHIAFTTSHTHPLVEPKKDKRKGKSYNGLTSSWWNKICHIKVSISFIAY